MAVYALLVGVNEYLGPGVPALQGCENDVELFGRTLQIRFGVEPDNILTLKSGKEGIRATRQNIIDQFQEHLIGKAKQADVAVFYFSGHGAQSRTHEIFREMEPDGLDESLVCHDSRTQGIPDLRDKDLRFLLKQLEKECGHIAVFLDCCHGGHGTRFLDEDMSHVRMVQADMQSYPLEGYLLASHLSASPTPEEVKALISPSAKHILLAGCRDYQLSREREQVSDEGRQYHGLFTYALCETLNTLQYPISYRELGTRIYTQVQKQQLSQSPQIEAIGDANAGEELLGGKVLPLNLLVFNRDKQWVVNAGAIHGFNKGDEIALFSAEVKDDFSAAPVVQLHQLDAFESTLLIPNTVSLDTGIQYNGLVIRRHFNQTAIRLQGDAVKRVEIQQKLLINASPNDPGRFLKLDEATARYTLHAAKDCYYVTQPDDQRPLFAKVMTADAVLKQLAIMARWWQKLDLTNPETRLPPDAVQILVRYEQQTYNSEDVTLRYQLQDDGTWKQPEFTLELSLNNTYPKALYCALLYFDGNTGEITGSPLITTTLLTHQQNAMPGRPNAMSVVPVYEGEPIPLKIDDKLHKQGVTKIQDFIKIIVSEKDFDASLLEQTGNELYSAEDSRSTRSGLNSTLEQFMEDAHRGLDLKPKAVRATDWYAKSITLTVIRPQEVQEIQSGKPTFLAADGTMDIRVEPHSSFHGTVRLINAYDENSHYLQTQGQKSLDKVTVVEEPALFANRDSMIDFSKGINADLGLDAIEVFVDSGARGEADATQQVSAANPLQLSFRGSIPAGEYIIPYTYDSDGELFLPLGRATNSSDGRTYIHIEQLPDEALRSSPDTKSLGRSLKIYFRKVVYRELLQRDEEVYILGTPRFAPNDPTSVEGYITDPQIISGMVEQARADKILLVIHGIIGSTDTMAGFVNLPYADGKYLRDEYDLVLTFDYENLNTYIQDVARALKERLQAVGISTESGKKVDIVAHSMGGLVSRFLIEREGGGAIVRKLVMVGTPNGGSPYATVKERVFPVLKTWVYSNVAVALNGLTNAFVGGAAIAGLMKLLDSIDNTLDQMAPDSDFLHEIAQSTQPSVPYALIAGSTDSILIDIAADQSRMARLGQYVVQRLKIGAYDLLTAQLFKESNDIAASYRSMTHFNPVWKANVAVETVKCDHLSYFRDKTTLQRIVQHLCT